MRYTLVALEGGQTVEIRDGAPMLVGRGLTSDIPVPDPTISRRHAEVSPAPGGGVIVNDLGSSNGSYRNGEPIGSPTTVRPGDIVTFGKVAFRLEEKAVAATSPVPAKGPMPGATIVRSVPVDLRDGLAAALRSGPHGAIVSPAEQTSEQRLQDRLSTLLDISTELTKQRSVDELLERVADQVLRILQVDRVAILLGEDADALTVKIARDAKGKALGEMVPRSIARSAYQERRAILSEDAAEDSRFGGKSIVLQHVRSAMCAPLVGSENRALGVLYVDSQMMMRRFSEDDLGFLVAFSGIAAVALENSQFADRIRKEALVRSNFERFFTPGLAARIAESPDAVRLGGEKKKVAVLFSDIRGFTAMSETMEPQRMASLLTDYFTEMVECVFRHGGTLDKFIGDAVMAQWGAPLSSGDDPARAMAAAIDMMESLDRLNAEWRAQGRPELHIGVGLNYGEAFAGNIGSERRLEYTVIGDTVNTASRLCGAADGGEILISDPMREALASPPALREHPPMELKGKSQPLRVFSVVR